MRWLRSWATWALAAAYLDRLVIRLAETRADVHDLRGNDAQQRQMLTTLEERIAALERTGAVTKETTPMKTIATGFLMTVILTLALAAPARAFSLPLGNDIALNVPFDAQCPRSWMNTNAPTLGAVVWLLRPAIEGQAIRLLGQQIGVAGTLGPWENHNATFDYAGLGAGIFGLFVQGNASPRTFSNAFLHLFCLDIGPPPAGVDAPTEG